MTDRAALRLLAILLPLAGIAALALAAVTGGLSHSFIDPDESAHYVNALFLGDWLRSGLASPMPFARDYYAHFPKLSIGHWPPGWYALLAPAYAVVRPSPFGASLLSAFVAGLPAVFAGWAMMRTGAGRWVAVAALIWVLLLPLEVESARYVLLDQPVALVAGAAAIAWLRAAERPSWGRLALFGVLAAFAPMVKGNGALVMLVPAIDILLSRRWRLLRDVRLYVVALATFVAVLPWYVVSFRIAAGGFNYAPGPAYAAASLGVDLAAIVANLGWGGVVLAIVGTAMARRDGRAGPVVRLAVAVIAATLVFQAAIPVALEDRYILPALPWAVGLAVLGAYRLYAAGSIAPRIVAAVLVALALIAPVRGLTNLQPKPDLGAPAIAARMVAAPGIWMVDGRAGGEGAVIAAAAYADAGRHRIWVARASQWLSSSDFMGNGYRLTATTPAAARAVLDRLGANGAVLVRDRGRYAYPHSIVLARAVAGDGFAATAAAYPIGTGGTIVARRLHPMPGNPALLAMGSGSRGVSAMIGGY